MVLAPASSRRSSIKNDAKDTVGKKIAYCNCASGIAGDMLLAAFIDTGISFRTLERLLKQRLRFDDFGLRVSTVQRHHASARRLDVKGDRTFSSPFEMRRIIARSTLAPATRNRALAILDRLIRAESRVHGVPEDKVHFHELNSVDTLIDVTGSCLVLELSGVEEVYSSPVNIGNPAPATVEIVKDCKIPVYSTTPRYELATPTGMAIISTVTRRFGAMPLMELQRSGQGAGTLELEERPNLLKVFIGTAGGATGYFKEDTVAVLSTNIDDMDPRIFPYVIERLLAAGARDAWLTQLLMKKGRPGIQLSVIADEEKEEQLAAIIFSETTTLGIRRRYVLEREVGKGTKTARLPGGGRRIKSEFEVMRKRAAKKKVPLAEILF
jgi:uncharacterized protein (TIGR00299 family) protein